MFNHKIAMVFCLLLLIASTSVFAANYQKENTTYKIKKERRTVYKGEYKGESPTPCIVKVTCKSDFPCRTYIFMPGPYVGFGVGLLDNYNRTSSVYKGLEGSLFAGYALISNSFYLAGEISAEDSLQLQNYRNDLNANFRPIGVKTTWGVGLSILPGFILADTLMAYLRIGGVLTHFQDIAQTAAGGQAGLGLEGTVSQNWDLRAEYIFTLYQSLTWLGKPRSDTFRLGFIYKFWG